METRAARPSEPLPRRGRVVPSRSGELWNYCGRCARPMAWFEQPKKVFNRTTGELVAVYLWQCPSYRGNEKPTHDQMGRRVYDPTIAVEQPT